MNKQPSVPFVELWEWLQGHPTSQYIGFTGWFPFLESMHVLAIGLVVGTILMVDLRLLGMSALSYPVSRMVRELTPWTWGAVVVAMVTGVGMFVTRAPAYVENPAFQLKLVFLVLAFVNMTFFQFRTYPRVQAWERTAPMPAQAKAAGAASLVLWAAIIVAGRWTGHII